MNPCKDQGGEERVAVAVFCFQNFDSKRGVEVCECVLGSYFGKLCVLV